MEAAGQEALWVESLEVCDASLQHKAPEMTLPALLERRPQQLAESPRNHCKNWRTCLELHHVESVSDHVKPSVVLTGLVEETIDLKSHDI